MRKPSFYAATFGIMRDSEGKILFQKRCNTGYRDGCYQLPCWHVEKVEGMEKSMIRKLQEEINIDVTSLELRHITQCIKPWWREYFNIYFEILEYTWSIENLEWDKCSELYWATNDEIQSNPLFEKDREILNYIERGVCFSESISKE